MTDPLEEAIAEAYRVWLELAGKPGTTWPTKEAFQAQAVRDLLRTSPESLGLTFKNIDYDGANLYALPQPKEPKS